MWLKIIQIVAAVAVQTGAADWAKAWLQKRLQAQIEKAKATITKSIAIADQHGVQGVYGVKINRKRTAKELVEEVKNEVQG